MTRTLRPVLALLSLALIATACIQTQATMLGSFSYAPVPEADVRIFTSEADLEGLRYEKLAIIHAQGSGEMTNEHQMLTAARRKAGSIGANGILYSKVSEPSAGAKVAGAVFGTGTQRRGEMTAIRVLGEKKAGDEQSARPEPDLPVLVLRY